MLSGELSRLQEPLCFGSILVPRQFERVSLSSRRGAPRSSWPGDQLQSSLLKHSIPVFADSWRAG